MEVTVTHTWVYGLSYPETGVFYVGISGNPLVRWSSHWAADGCCTSYDVISRYKPLGIRFNAIIFGKFDTRIEALRLERALIDDIPGLSNDPFGGVLSRRRYPKDWRDEKLLKEAYEQVGWVDTGVVDCDPEYVDERYDCEEGDLVAPVETDYAEFEEFGTSRCIC